MDGPFPFNNVSKTLRVEEMTTSYPLYIAHSHAIETYAAHIACCGRFPDIEVVSIFKVAIKLSADAIDAPSLGNL